MSKKDFLVVGAGSYGCTFARVAAENGKKVLIIDKRNHIGGNAYTRQINNDYDMHVYGAHIFHTEDKRLKQFVERFQDFRHYNHTLLARVHQRNYSFPINLRTLNEIYGVRNPTEAVNLLDTIRCKSDVADSAEDALYQQIGKGLTDLFYRTYSFKHWGLDLKQLPASIVQRVPIRFTYDETYFRHKYQMLPVLGGYTKMFENMLDHPNIELQTSAECTDITNAMTNFKVNHVVHTGPIDHAMKLEHGRLPFRALKFETLVHHEDQNPERFSGKSVVNVCDESAETRILDHALFGTKKPPVDRYLTLEYPMSTEEAIDSNVDPMYPIRTDKHLQQYGKYVQSSKSETNWLTFGGRNGTYKYLDMDAAMQQAITTAKKKFGLELLP